ncbi:MULTISPECIES: aminoacyl-tRNA deacylase [Caldilinea]|jgi:Cys-tRNA(Pro)/Cys-tRNA(Cys) deacylase|uniref:aminoacyl-tRNA deacylase n=1 Tax=Caldilinea TaxID=233191 RepID=UPI000305A8F8|nr:MULTISPECIES: aminoacyl-tRNA deacylase [Caldilinea]GIV72293.1 MAG: Cys-tRNA(Pro)/Cys-tRNA(Cys) deacylase [Caldilinea sp.]
MAEPFKNNVTRFLDSRKVRYQVYTYDYDAGIHSAVEVAAAIGLPPEQVFKTLVVLPEDPQRKPMLVIIPGPATLDLRAFAQAVNLKKVKMATHEQAEQMTGLKTGGISALALINKGFEVYLDKRAQRFDAIAVSAGQRGANVLLPVQDLVRLVNARWVQLPEQADG